MTKEASLIDVEYEPLNARGISEETCRFFGYGTSRIKDRKVQVSQFRIDNAIVAQKYRTADKSFTWAGETKVDLFGQHLWPKGGKKLVVTEGEIDALSLSEVYERKWPVVSIPNGVKTAAKFFERSIEFLESFEEVIIMFDSDEHGQRAAEECASALSPGKCKLARLPLKDASEMLVAGRTSELRDAVWKAKEWRPDSIVYGDDILTAVLTEEEFDSLAYPWAGLDTLMRGIRLSEIITIIAGTGVGKSSVCRELVSSLILTHGAKVGYMALEESIKETGEQLIATVLDVPSWDWESRVTEAEIIEGHAKLFGENKCLLYDHWGASDPENVLGKIRYLAKAGDCTHIVLDNLTAVVASMAPDKDERRQIDDTMDKLRRLTHDLNISLIIVNHLVKGEAFEEGGRVKLKDSRGSGAIANFSHNVIALERDQQDADAKNITTVRVLKCRKTGQTGEAGQLEYDPKTGRMNEIDIFNDAGTQTGEGRDF